MPSAHRAVVWERTDQPGAEYFELRERPRSWDLHGSAVVFLDGVPALATYRIACDRTWRTRAASVIVTTEGTRSSLHLRVDPRRRWWCNGAQRPDLDGCDDIDLAFTPATNTLPIRRLALGVGESRDVAAAWVRIPHLAIEPLYQRYTRLSHATYEYTSGGGAFSARLDTDEQGLVTHYPPSWRMVGR